MAKTRTAFFCQNCGAESAKWVGKCPSCNEWNTYVEEVIEKSAGDVLPNLLEEVENKPHLLSEPIRATNATRVASRIAELDRVLGGGLVQGSLLLVGGEPGIGKSTLMLQLVSNIRKKVLYVSGEESIEQIKLRSERLHTQSDNCYLLAETNLSQLVRHAESLKPDLVIIDSIQTLYSTRVEAAIGSISQVKECTGQLMKYAKTRNVTVILIGHVNKEGAIAGPKVLEHMVDTVVQFEGDRHLSYRILRTIKNRFGPANELGIFEMTGVGLREVANPSEILIPHREEGMSGSVLGVTLEGNRPLLLDVQTLASPSNYGNPQRSSTGYDQKRLSMLLAVLERRIGLRLSVQDIFLNIAGGIKIQDTSLDLAICVALFSSFEDIPVGNKMAFAAEVGLGGEIRPLNRIALRITECQKLGIETVYVSKFNLKKEELSQFKNIEIVTASKLTEVLQHVFG